MPALGMAQETGRVLRWLKAEGDAVAKGEPLMEVETDKVTVEIEAPAEGLLAAVRAEAGTDVPVGQAVALILAPGEVAPENGGAARSAEAPSAPPAAVAAAGRPLRAGRAARRRLASPKARRLAAEQGIDLDALGDGSGPHGAVLAADVAAARPAAAARPPAAAQAGAAAELPVSRIWEVMAERTTRSWTTAPHFYLVRDVDAGRLQSWRRAARARLGLDVSVTDLLVRATAAALRGHPRANAAWVDGAVRRNDEINVGIAVAVEDGLVVPVVHGADRIGVAGIAARREEIVARAREGSLRPDDVERGTFTISNLGMYGVDAFNAVLAGPQAAILAVGRIAERVVAVDGAPAVRPMATLTLSCDHRTIDGATAARFLSELADLIEEPAGLAD
ncbi:MAG TPA: dihydrolipoamide acetyltransferase family protein [Gaiellaceae bacterium]|nr:dihydrolipoamide acetyltransferase family protein [Gaiellaceae bacterium]